MGGSGWRSAWVKGINGYYFTYIDLICVDSGVFDQEVSNYIAVAAGQEYEYFLKREPIKRIELRLDRAQKFIDYLRAEELREREAYFLAMPESDMFTHKAGLIFAEEKERVRTSALKRKR